jgi:hypothetical protein
MSENQQSAADLVAAIDRLTSAIEGSQAAASVPIPGMVNFGWFGRGDDDNRSPALVESLTNSIKEYAARLVEVLKEAVDETVSLTIDTSSATDPAAVQYRGGAYQGATLRASTRVAGDGDTQLCLYGAVAETDRVILDTHIELVGQAQAGRIALLKALLETAVGLI